MTTYQSTRPAPSSYRPSPAANTYNGSYASPTSSEFSFEDEERDSVWNWDNQRVAEWLESIKAGQYVDLFKANDINGANLIDMDQAALKELGIKKVGDRVRIGSQVKQFRYLKYNRKLRPTTESISTAHNQVPTPPSSGSPRPLRSVPVRGEKRAASATRYESSAQRALQSTSSRPNSPFTYDNDQRNRTSSRLGGGLSPWESTQRELGGSYFQGQTSAPHSARPADTPQTARFPNYRNKPSTPADTPQTAHFTQPPNLSLSVDTAVANGPLPTDKPWIRVLYDNSRASVFNVEGCMVAEEVILKTLKKGILNEAHVKSYCFYVLDGTEPDPAYCRRLSDSELMRICTDPSRKEKERLIFRKIHAGEPEGSQLQNAAAIGLAQMQNLQSASSAGSQRSQLKLQKPTGEPLKPITYPMSPASVAERQRHLNETARGLEGGEFTGVVPRPRPRRHKELHGSRPPSELVVADPKTYFPDIDEGKIENLRRMSVRRSQRVSRAQSRLSVASNASFASSLDDAPPLPRISDSAWYNNNVNSGAGPAPRPLSVLSVGRPMSTYRESFASSALDPLNEEDTNDEPNRKSYVSFSEGSPDDHDAAVGNGEHGSQKTYFDELGGSLSMTDPGSLNEQLTQEIAKDGEDEDEELVNFLKPEAFEDIKHIRGKLIGQGSFGSVYLALHAVTAELMAVKQVELPSTEGTTIDAKKNNMVEALKREIALLRELKHPHIVQYLGSSSDANNLNIFLEYVPGGSIAKMLVDFGSLNENQITKLVPQILVGLAYLHSKDIIHRDIKGANILVDNKGLVKISDFGISKRVQDSKTLLSESGAPKGRGLAANRVSLQGSVFWMAPEVVRQTSYTRKADIWSLGCLVIEMFTGSHPHPNMSQLQAIFKIGGKGAPGNVGDPAPEVPEYASSEAKEFLRKTFAVEQDRRPEAQDLLKIEWLKGKH